MQQEKVLSLVIESTPKPIDGHFVACWRQRTIASQFAHIKSVSGLLEFDLEDAHHDMGGIFDENRVGPWERCGICVKEDMKELLHFLT